MRAVGDGGNASAILAADKMDLVQMMLDCAETMTSVLDDVTDMGELFLPLCVVFIRVNLV